MKRTIRDAGYRVHAWCVSPVWCIPHLTKGGDYVSSSERKTRRRQRRRAHFNEAARLKRLQSFEGLNERIAAFQKRIDLATLKRDSLTGKRDEKYHPDGTPRDAQKEAA